MFVQNLNERQQSVLLALRRRGDARGSARSTRRSLMAIDVLRNQAQPGIKAEDVPIEALPDLFEDRLSRVSLLLELVGMGYANEDFDPTQSELVNQIARAFGFHENGTIEAVEKWVQDELALMKEAQKLMEG